MGNNSWLALSVLLLVLLVLCEAKPVSKGPPAAATTVSTGSSCLLCNLPSSSSSSSAAARASSSSSFTQWPSRSSSSSSMSSAIGGGNVQHLAALIVGDPSFVGLRGQQYQVHGIDGGVYNLISTRHVQLNSRFVFLTGPRPCPSMPTTGRKSAACFVHDGSYLADIALQTSADDQLLVEAGGAAEGFALVSLNGDELTVGDRAELVFADGSSGSVHFTSSHELSITASFYDIIVDNSDDFVNLHSVVVSSSQWPAMKRAAPHGLLGQTWRRRGDGKAGTAAGVIEGVVDDYLIEDDDLFGTAFVHNRFESGAMQASTSQQPSPTSLPHKHLTAQQVAARLLTRE